MVSINEFLSLYSSKSTLKGYASSLKQFFSFLGVDAERYFDAYKKAVTLQERDETLDRIMLDVTRWLKHMETEGLSPKSIQCKSGCIRAFLLANRVDLGRAYWKKMKITGESLTQDRIPTKDELRRIMSHLDLPGRAYLLLKISTGLRINDVLALEAKSIDFSRTPPRVRYYNHKIKRWCYAFLTKEATLTVTEWIRNREKSLLDIQKTAYRIRVNKDAKKTISFEEFSKSKKNTDKLFPFTDSSIYNRYWEALDKAGLGERDGQTGIRLLHDHTLRKYTKTKMSRALPEAIADALIGHTGGLNSLKTVYNRHSDSIEALAEDFLKAEAELSLTTEVTSSKEIAEINEKLDNQETKMKYLKQENEGLKALVSGLQQLIYGIDDKDLYVPAHLQGYVHGTKIGFSYAPEDTYFSQEQFEKFLKSKTFLKSKEYKEFLKKVKKNKKQNQCSEDP